MRRLPPAGALAIAPLWTSLLAPTQATDQASDLRVAVSVSPGCTIQVGDVATAAEAVGACGRGIRPVITIEEDSPAPQPIATPAGPDDAPDAESPTGQADDGQQRSRVTVVVINF
jgi:hypothetical protein